VLELRLLGRGQARYNDRPLPGFPSQLPYLLFCYLVVNRNHVHSREQLAAIFWADFTTSASLKHLRHVLWRMRQLLQAVGAVPEEYLSIEDGAVSFRTTGSYWLDVEAFESVTTLYQKHDGWELNSEQAAHLERAVELYSGDLLDGIYEDWCLYDRERLHVLYLNSLSKLAAFHEATGNYERGLQFGRQTLACDNTHESTHRQMMRLYWLLGDRNAALLQYKLCLQTLGAALDVPPMEETQRLYRQILDGPPPSTPSRHSPRTRTPYDGRQPHPAQPRPPGEDEGALPRSLPAAGHPGSVPTPSPGVCGDCPVASRLEEAAVALQQAQDRLAEAGAELARVLDLINRMQEDAHPPSERRPEDGPESQP